MKGGNREEKFGIDKESELEMIDMDKLIGDDGNGSASSGGFPSGASLDQLDSRTLSIDAPPRGSLGGLRKEICETGD